MQISNVQNLIFRIGVTYKSFKLSDQDKLTDSVVCFDIGDTSITIIFTVIVGSEHTAIHKGHGMGTSSPSVSARSNWFHAVLNEAVGFGHPAPYVVGSRICHCFISIQREVIAVASRMMNR